MILMIFSFSNTVAAVLRWRLMCSRGTEKSYPGAHATVIVDGCDVSRTLMLRWLCSWDWMDMT
jgi:hypothetical protein